jgi:hypothetical protein
LAKRRKNIENEGFYIDFGKDIVEVNVGLTLNCTSVPEECKFTNMRTIVSPDAPEDIYISPVGCYGIVRRKQERNLKINARLEEVLLSISLQMTPEEIEKKSRVQKRGRFSDSVPENRDDANTADTLTDEAIIKKDDNYQMSTFDFAVEQPKNGTFFHATLQ